MAHVRERPPLRTSIEVETPSGRRYRWAENEPRGEDVPSGVRWSDTMPGGFESMDCVLPRKSGVDYSDLEQLSTLRVRGASGDIAGEYRLERSPRTSGEQMAISPGAVGWQAHLEDDKSAMMPYVDRDLSHWRSMSRSRRLTILNLASGNPRQPVDHGVGADSTLPAITMQFDGEWGTDQGPISEAVYDAGSATVGLISANWERHNAGGGNWAWDVGVANSDASALSGLNTSGDLQNEPNTTGAVVFAPATPKRYGLLRFMLLSGAANNEPGLGILVNWRLVSVHGNHGLTPRVNQGGAEPDGFWASDIVTHAVSTWAPLLSAMPESVQSSGFVIPHMAFLEPTTAGEIVRQATRFGLQDWAVWDNKTFWWHNRGAFSKRWRARVAPAQLDETGPQVDRLWESIIVSYQDVDGSTRTVGPPGLGTDVEDASLKDDDPDNPANQLGIARRDVLQMGTSTSAGAIEVGRRFLEASKELDRSGRAQLVGHVGDDHGVVHPYWRPRAGDYISFVDASDPSYRRIVRTDKDHSTRTCGLDLDAPPEGLQALLERLGVVLVPLGIS